MKKFIKLVITTTVFATIFTGCGTKAFKENVELKEVPRADNTDTEITTSQEIGVEVPIEFFGSKKYPNLDPFYGLNYNGKTYVDLDTVDLFFNMPVTDVSNPDVIKIGGENKVNNYYMYSDYSNLPDIADMFINAPTYKVIIEGSTSYYYVSSVEYEDFKNQAEEHLLNNNFKKLSDDEKQELVGGNSDFYTDRELFNQTHDNKYINNKDNEIYELLGAEWKNNSGHYIQIINDGYDINGSPVIIVRYDN